MENTKWYHKTWIRVLAGLLVVLLVFTTVGYNILRLRAESFFEDLAGDDNYLKEKSKSYTDSFDPENIILNMTLYSDLKKLLEAGEYEEAIDKTNSLIKSETDEDRKAQLYQLLCELYYNNGDYEEAAKEADNCVKDLLLDLDDNALLFCYIAAISYMHIENYEKSIKYIDTILAVGEDPDLYYYRGINNMAAENYKDATTDFEKAMDLGKTDTDVYYDIGICQISDGEVEKGIENLRYVIDQNDKPELTTAASNIISVLSQGN